MRPSPIVTGSISSSTRAMRGSRQWKLIRTGMCRYRSTGKHMANCAAVPASTPIAYA